MCSCMRTTMDVSDEASSEVEPSDVASFAFGDTFSSYDFLKKNANTALVYYSIILSCVFGGKKYNNKGSGKRPHQRYTELVDYL